MKKLLARPGFEAMFYAGLIILFVLPAMVFAQSGGKSVNINVINNDTLINGKKISELKPAEKKEAQEALASLGTTRQQELDRIFKLRTGTHIHMDSIRANGPSIRYQNSPGRLNNFIDTIRLDQPFDDGTAEIPGREYITKRLPYDAKDRMPTMRPDMRNYHMPIMRPRDGSAVVTLNYNNIDKNGIPTHSNYRVSAAPFDIEKKLAGSNTPDLAIVDVALVPEFSAGKTLLVFTMPFTTQADISFTDSDGKTLWNEKSTGNKFNKSFALPMNGVYYLVVKQGGKAAVRKVVKE